MENETTPSQQKICRNCQDYIPQEAKYCQHCSQKYTTGRVSIRSLVVEFFTEYFNLDSKLFKTAAALFIPGKLTNEYFSGRHKSFAKPLRLFLVSGILLFAFISFQISEADMGDELELQIKEDIDWVDFTKQLDTAKIKTNELFPQKMAITATDSLILFIQKDKGDVSDSTDIDINLNGFPFPKMSKKDILNDSPDELVKKYGSDLTFWQAIVFRQTLKLKKGGRDIVNFFLGKTIITLFIMMPFLALILRLLYFRRDYYYVEHLIFAFHFHAFAFLVSLFLGLTGSYLPDFIITISIVGIFIYLYIAMLRVYKQGWFKTFVKFFTLMFMYLFIAIVFSILSVMISFLLF